MTTTAPPAWDDVYCVGVTELDEQHRNLFLVLAELAGVLTTGRGEEAVLGVMKALLVDCANHFSAEEEYLEGVRYPGTVKQRVQQEGDAREESRPQKVR